MTIGPVDIEPDILTLGSKKMIYNRTETFSAFFKGITENLQYFFQTKNPVYTFASSGTGAMEAALTNTLSKGDKVLVIERGKFGVLWAEIAEGYGLDVERIELIGEEQIKPEVLRQKLAAGVKAVCINANETSIGILTDVAAIGEVVKDFPALFIVDAISSIGADPFKTDEWHCDLVIASSQKALALPPGLGFISVSPKAASCFQTSNLPKFYFDLKKYEANIARGQTPFTPATGLLFQLDARLRKIKETGLDKVQAEAKKLSEQLRDGLKALSMQLVAAKYVPASMVAFYAPDGIDPRSITDSLLEKYGIQLAGSPAGSKAERIIRVGLIGAMTSRDVDHFLESLSAVLLELKTKK